jgi:hypothetical protein
VDSRSSGKSSNTYIGSAAREIDKELEVGEKNNLADQNVRDRSGPT